MILLSYFILLHLQIQLNCRLLLILFKHGLRPSRIQRTQGMHYIIHFPIGVPSKLKVTMFDNCYVFALFDRPILFSKARCDTHRKRALPPQKEKYPSTPLSPLDLHKKGTRRLQFQNQAFTPLHSMHTFTQFLEVSLTELMLSNQSINKKRATIYLPLFIGSVAVVRIYVNNRMQGTLLTLINRLTPL